MAKSMDKADDAIVHHEERPDEHPTGRTDVKGDAEVDQYAQETAHLHIDAATNKRLFRKINKRVLAIMLGTYFCQALDKGTLGFSSIMGINDDAHLHGNQFSWLGTILYMGILVGEYPTNFLLQKLPVAKYLAVNVFLWGAVVTCSAAATNWGALMAVRFLLGIFESCVQPTFIILTAMWYTREEQAVLTSLWYCMMGVQLMVGGLIAYGVSHIKDAPVFSWQVLFMVLGLATVLWSIVIACFLPDSPMKAKCYNEDDKRLMFARVRGNQTGMQNKTYKRYQVIEALVDPYVWCCVLLQCTSTLIIGGLGVFSNLIIKSLGFTVLQTQLLNIAQGAVTILVMVGGAMLASKTKQTLLVMFLWTLPAIAGTGILMGIAPNSKNAGGLLVAFYCTQFILAEGNLIFSLISRNVAGQTKKGVTLSMTFIAWAAGNMTAPQLFQTSDAPRYRHGFTAHLCLYVIYIAEIAVTWLILTRRNKARAINAASRAEEMGSGAGSKTDAQELALQDLTDRENPEFKYVV
ncbi:MFS transporter [Lasiodiplodia theobromae]|uniref:MFS transporter n=1 Tax=Lasiodiplodia theobromae TaxID=45133 RepID=UPI0015C31ADA|nr:MFS transporter [Lasiodiplodia theobromae]KAF4545900.1 MFS transporter [Lasiodiplodia theobromae]